MSSSRCAACPTWSVSWHMSPQLSVQLHLCSLCMLHPVCMGWSQVYARSVTAGETNTLHVSLVCRSMLHPQRHRQCCRQTLLREQAVASSSTASMPNVRSHCSCLPAVLAAATLQQLVLDVCSQTHVLHACTDAFVWLQSCQSSTACSCGARLAMLPCRHGIWQNTDSQSC